VEAELSDLEELPLAAALTLVGARLGVRIEQACASLIDALANDQIIARGRSQYAIVLAGSGTMVRPLRFGDRFGSAFKEHVGPVELPAEPFRKVVGQCESAQADSVHIAWPDSEITIHKTVDGQLRELPVTDVRIRRSDLDRMCSARQVDGQLKMAQDPPKVRAWEIAEDILNGPRPPRRGRGRKAELARLVRAAGCDLQEDTIRRHIAPGLADWEEKNQDR
jgi:hypothetical protein